MTMLLSGFAHSKDRSPRLEQSPEQTSTAHPARADPLQSGQQQAQVIKWSFLRPRILGSSSIWLAEYLEWKLNCEGG